MLSMLTLEEIERWRPDIIAAMSAFDFDENGLTTADIAALTESLRLQREHPDHRRREQIEAKLLECSSWIECAKFASYSRQCDNLRLKPWQSPPMVGNPDDRLLIRMRRLGISQYAPDPMAAIAAWTKENRKRRRS
jgi:hypothetical protein